MFLLARADAAILIEVDHALVIELLDDFLGLLVLHCQSVIISQPLLCLGQASDLRLEVLFLQQCLFLVSLDLGMGASALATYLQHVGTGSFVEGDGGTFLESCMDFGIHLDHQITLLSNSCVPFIDLPLDPLREGIAENAVGYVSYPLLWQFEDLLFIRVVREGLRVLSNEIVEELHLERLVLWDLQMAALVVLEELLLPVDQVFQL